MTDDDWDFFNKSVGKLEKEVITLKKENEKLKENIRSMLFTDDVVQKRYDKVKQENTKLKELLKRVVNATDFRHEIKIASVIDYRVWYNIASEIKQVLGEKK